MKAKLESICTWNFFDHDSFENQLEHQRLLDEAAANEIVNLMNKDYQVPANPRRKPPIHNHKPDFKKKHLQP